MNAPHNHQHNHARGHGRLIVNQGGNQTVNLHSHAARKRTGVAILIVLGLDVVFFIYGALAYTGHSGNSGDLWRAGIMLVLMGVTGNLIRRWFRQRL
jgi:hypothetical protein